MATAVAVDRRVIPYAPRPLQGVLHRALEDHRWAVAVCHRRFGKTVLAINHLIKRALLCPHDRPRFAYLAPFRNQAKDIAWAYLKHYARPVLADSPNESELRVDLLNGATVRIYGADNEDALRGIYLDGVVLDEYGQMSPTVWGEVLRPLLSDREGWAFFIGTPNGRNQFYELIHGTSEWIGAKADPDWFFAEYKASQTGVLPAAELDDARRTMTGDQYQQEYECSFEASVKGAVYAREMQAALESGRITRVAFEPLLPVDTSWDLGIDDATAIWFSQSAPGGEVRLLGYYEATGYGLPHYVGLLKREQDKHGFVYGDHFLPHDVEITELGTGVSRLETLRSLGLTNVVVVPRVGLITDGLNATRMLLPKCWFNESACARGIDALRNYRWKPETTHPTSDTKPVHDWASHGADALRTLACAPRRVGTLLKSWNMKNRDVDPADARYGKVHQTVVRRRGGW